MPEPKPDIEPTRVLMVCLGNICRSPLAEAILRDLVAERGLTPYYHIASAGTGDWHVGSGADPRSAATARRHGLDLGGHVARQITAAGIDDWDWFVAMDASNRLDLLQMGTPEERVLLMRQFEAGCAPEYAPDVPDPYYGGPDGFEIVWRMLRDNARGLLDFLETRRTA
ncbi:MAG: low molecular weight protein-tyrosine-phosphatase [Mariprofundaceae bacterium]